MNQPSCHRLTRRQFLHSVAAVSTVTGATTLLAACQLPPVREPASQTEVPSVDTSSEAVKPTADPSTVQEDGKKKARVAFVKTSDRVQGVRQALALLGTVDVAKRAILLKPNFNSADPPPGSTHPEVLQTVVDELWQRQAKSITLADRSGMGNTRQVMEQLGIFEMAKAADVKPVVLNELAADAWEMIRLPDSHWTQGFPFASCCLMADAVVQTCCLKTHRYGGHFTLSLKNSVGLVAQSRPGDSYDYMGELHRSRYQRQMIAEINAAYTPTLIVLDGVEAFVRGGPATGERVAANVILAGSDRIAIDAVGVALLRHFGTTPEVSAGTIFQQEQIARAVELGLGVERPQQIELVTGDAESEAYAAQIRQVLVA